KKDGPRTEPVLASDANAAMNRRLLQLELDGVGDHVAVGAGVGDRHAGAGAGVELVGGADRAPLAAVVLLVDGLRRVGAVGVHDGYGNVAGAAVGRGPHEIDLVGAAHRQVGREGHAACAVARVPVVVVVRAAELTGHRCAGGPAA